MSATAHGFATSKSRSFISRTRSAHSARGPLLCVAGSTGFKANLGASQGRQTILAREVCMHAQDQEQRAETGLTGKGRFLNDKRTRSEKKSKYLDSWTSDIEGKPAWNALSLIFVVAVGAVVVAALFAWWSYGSLWGSRGGYLI